MIFAHAGKAGDVIWSLPVIRASGGGHVLLRPSPVNPEVMSPEYCESLATLLQIQPYVHGVSLDRWPAEYDLDVFRAFLPCGNVVLANFRAAGRRPNLSPWLTVDEPRRVSRVVISRTARYVNVAFDWRAVLDRYEDVAFVGTSQEWLDFCRDVRVVEHASTPTMLDLARVIAGADLFIGGQGAAHAVAMGLGKRIVLAASTALCSRSVLFDTPLVTNYIDGPLTLPSLARPSRFRLRRRARCCGGGKGPS